MAANNHVHITGNATRDPELKFTSGGRAVCQLGVAVNKRYQQNGEWQEKVSYFNVVIWGAQAENVAATVTKGMRISVTGELEQREYQTREGEKRTVVEINADDVSPSLRFATGQITRNPRENEGAPQKKSGNAAFDMPAADSFDEEPF